MLAIRCYDQFTSPGKRRTGGGIGVSALEEDDNDVYDNDDMASYDRMAGPASAVDADGILVLGA